MAAPSSSIASTTTHLQGLSINPRLTPGSLAYLRESIHDYESRKGFNTQGASEHRNQMEVLYAKVIAYKNSPEFEKDGKPLAAKLMRLYAMTYYPEFENSRVLILHSIDALLKEVKLDSNGSGEVPENLADWAQASLKPANRGSADAIEMHLLTLTSDDIINKTSNNPSLQWALASSLRWLGHSYQNIDLYGDLNFVAEAFKKSTEPHLLKTVFDVCPKFVKMTANLNDDWNNYATRLFDLIYGSSGKLLAPLTSEEAKREKVQLIYNSTMFLEVSRKGNSLENTWKIYDAEILQKKPEPAMVAMVHNLFSVQYVNRGEFTKAAELGQVSYAYRKANPPAPDAPANVKFNHANALVNFAGLRAKQGLKDPKSITESIKKDIDMEFEVAKAWMAHERTKENPQEHPYFSLWECSLARWMAVNKDINGALALLEVIKKRMQALIAEQKSAPVAVKAIDDLMAVIKAHSVV